MVPEDAPARTVLDDTIGGSLQGRKSFDIGTQVKIGRFVVLEKLGEGGMGLVLAAFDPQLDRRVAIKMLHDHVSETQGSRLEREAKAMAQLSHPNVLTVHETGLFGDRLYIAMELVDGQTLSRWLREQPRTHGQIFELVMQAGRGLAAAHAVGLVHRDFKPDNVLVGKDGRVRVSDFGLVSSSGEAVTTVDGNLPDVRSPSSLTQTGAVMGTPLYMAPEQHGGKVADAKADQFSFCVTLWQALCDELPYGADTYDQLVDNVTLGKLRAIPRGVRVPSKVRAILQRGLSADPSDRFPSMQALLGALDRARRPARWPYVAAGVALLAGGGVVLALTLGQSDRDPCAGSPQRLTGVWDAARKTTLATAFSAARGSDVWLQLERDLDRYTSTWVTHHRDVCRATHVRGEQSPLLLDLRMRCLDGRLAELNALLARFGEVTHDTVFKAIDATAALPDFADCDDADRLRAAIPLPADPASRARIAELEQRFAEAVSFDKTAQWGRAKEIVDPLVGQARLVGYAPLEAKLVLLRAGLQYRGGELAAAATSYREAAEVAARARDDQRLAQSWIDLMNVLAASGKYSDALALETIAKTSAERVSDQPRLGARFCNALAGIYLATGKYPEARVQYEKALAFVRQDGPDSDLLGPALLNFGIALWYTGDLDGAKQRFEDARDRFVAKLGPRHPSLGYVYRNLGDLAAARQDIDGALASYQRAYVIFEGAHGPDHIDVAIALEPLSYAYARKGDAAKAREAGEKALAIREKKLGAEHPSIATTLNSLADAEVADGKPESLARAVGYLERSIAIQDKAFGPDHPKTPESLDRLGEAQAKLAHHPQALAAFQRSVAIRTKVLGPHHNDVAYGHLRIAEAELAAKHFAPSAAAFQRAEEIFRTNDPKDSDVQKAQAGRARALLAAGKRTEAIALATAARDALAGNTAAKPLADAIATWLQSVAAK
jgi:tetratricopeptide (TPR) repeat protein